MNQSNVRRVLHVAPTPFFSDRGCHIRIRGLVLGLRSLNVENIVCTYGLGNDVPDVDTVRCPKIPGYTKTAAGPSIFRFIADPLLVLTVMRQIRAFRPDILHCHLHEGVLIGWLAKYFALRPGLRIVFDVQGGLGSELVSYGHLKNAWLRKLVHWIESFIIRRADAYSCSSQASVDLLVDQFGVDTAIVAHVPDGADVPLDLPLPDKNEQDSLPVAIYTGGLTESKGLDMLKCIIKEAADRQLKLRFVIVGYPTDELDQYLHKHGLKNCEIAGRIAFSELPEYLRKAHLCIEPKSAETSEASGKLLNYMASGRPTVCFDTPNNRKILGESGYFAKEAKASSFVDQLEATLDDGDAAWQRGSRAREIIRKQFSWPASAQRIMSRYNALLA
jgi:glycosyltransferase involved in cell wall biosynthesis